MKPEQLNAIKSTIETCTFAAGIIDENNKGKGKDSAAGQMEEASRRLQAMAKLLNDTVPELRVANMRAAVLGELMHKIDCVPARSCTAWKDLNGLLWVDDIVSYADARACFSVFTEADAIAVLDALPLVQAVNSERYKSSFVPEEQFDERTKGKHGEVHAPTCNGWWITAKGIASTDVTFHAFMWCAGHMVELQIRILKPERVKRTWTTKLIRGGQRAENVRVDWGGLVVRSVRRGLSEAYPNDFTGY